MLAMRKGLMELGIYQVCEKDLTGHRQIISIVTDNFLYQHCFIDCYNQIFIVLLKGEKNSIFQLALLASFSQEVSPDVIFTNPKVAWNPIFYLKHFKRMKSTSLTGKSDVG